MIVYADSSFVVSLYVTDAHSEKARTQITQVQALLFTALHLAEWVHALTKLQFWGNLSPEQARQIDARFSTDQTTNLWLQTGLPESAFDVCAELARRHGAKLGVRTLDSLHVACALELKADRFWTFDERQARLAKAEGLKILG